MKAMPVALPRCRSGAAAVTLAIARIIMTATAAPSRPRHATSQRNPPGIALAASSTADSIRLARRIALVSAWARSQGTASPPTR